MRTGAVGTYEGTLSCQSRTSLIEISVPSPRSMCAGNAGKMGEASAELSSPATSPASASSPPCEASSAPASLPAVLVRLRLPLRLDAARSCASRPSATCTASPDKRCHHHLGAVCVLDAERRQATLNRLRWFRGHARTHVQKYAPARRAPTFGGFRSTSNGNDVLAMAAQIPQTGSAAL